MCPKRMSSGTPAFWFPAKRRGWGWGPPVTWQGRLFLGIWATTVVISSPLLVQRGFYSFLVFFVLMLAVLIWVNGNWRLTFEFKDGHAYIVDYEDYH